MTDFFISYTGVDTSWAEWIGYALEEEGFSTVIQAWDFRPGSNFVIEMQNATAAERTIMVLTPEYMQSVFTSPEWAAAFAQDSQGLARKLVPVMVKTCQPTGLLASLVHISIIGLDEDAARAKLIAGVNGNRAKPASRPAFPGAAAPQKPHKAFPGPSAGAAATPGPGRGNQPASVYMPTPRRVPSDMDKRRFIKQSFETIKTLFESGLEALSQQHSSIEHDFTPSIATDFRAEIFLDGTSKCHGRVWLGGMHSENNICYSETRGIGNGCNEIISLSDSRDDLMLTALMASGYTQFERTLDMKRLTQEQAANYLWHRFVAPLER